MADFVATVLHFLFGEDKKSHPMPTQASETMFQKIRLVVNRKEDRKDGKE